MSVLDPTSIFLALQCEMLASCAERADQPPFIYLRPVAMQWSAGSLDVGTPQAHAQRPASPAVSIALNPVVQLTHDMQAKPCSPD